MYTSATLQKRGRQKNRATSSSVPQIQGMAMAEKGPDKTGVPLFLRAVQRDEPGSAPSFQLTTPSLLRPPDPMARFRPTPGLQLQFPPELEMQLRLMLGQQLDPSRLVSALGQLDLSLPVSSVAGPSGAGGPSLLGPGAAPTPSAEPLVPRGAGPERPRTGSAGDVWRAVYQTPAVRRLIENAQTTILDRLLLDWGRLSLGEQVGVTTFGVVIAAGALGGVLSQPDTRGQMLELLNGRIWPVPGVDFLNVELRFMEPDIMFGIHVDVGRLLPSSWGFGPSSPHAIGGPPRPEPFVPGQRQVQREAVAETELGNRGLATHIENAAGRGMPLPPHLHRHLESTMEKHFPPVHIHTDTQAHDLAQTLQASAFTSGNDIFFRAGAYEPDSPQGLKLLVHEAVHVAQQASGPVSGLPTAGGVSVSEPEDPFEREAEHLSDRLRPDERPRHI
jgi:hypothetical protein